MGALRSVSTSSGTSNSASGSSYETDEVIIKLAKKNDQAVLNFEITGTTRVGRKVRIGHDVKIEVMKPADVVKLSEPMCPEPDVCVFSLSQPKKSISLCIQIHVLLPSLQKIRTIVERLRSMSDVLAIRASQSGCLQLSINTESVKVDTEWKNCTIPQMSFVSGFRRDDFVSHDFMLQ